MNYPIIFLILFFAISGPFEIGALKRVKRQFWDKNAVKAFKLQTGSGRYNSEHETTTTPYKTAINALNGNSSTENNSNFTKDSPRKRYINQLRLKKYRKAKRTENQRLANIMSANYIGHNGQNQSLKENNKYYESSTAPESDTSHLKQQYNIMANDFALPVKSVSSVVSFDPLVPIGMLKLANTLMNGMDTFSPLSFDIEEPSNNLQQNSALLYEPKKKDMFSKTHLSERESDKFKNFKPNYYQDWYFPIHQPYQLQEAGTTTTATVRYSESDAKEKVLPTNFIQFCSCHIFKNNNFGKRLQKMAMVPRN